MAPVPLEEPCRELRLLFNLSPFPFGGSSLRWRRVGTELAMEMQLQCWREVGQSLRRVRRKLANRIPMPSYRLQATDACGQVTLSLPHRMSSHPPSQGSTRGSDIVLAVWRQAFK